MTIMHQNKFNILLIVLIVIISTALLIGNRLNTTWSGGDGYEQHAVAENFKTKELYHRGETISSFEKETPMMIRFGGTYIYLDENTEVKIIDGREGQLTVNVIQGRVVLKGEITVSTRDLRTHFNGTGAFVHYAWDDRIQIISIDGSAILERADQEEIITGRMLTTTTLEPYTDEFSIFDIETSSARYFYESALGID
jgi:hypothetical protein